MNILCLDHVCHKKTKSFDFFIDLLRGGGCSVEVFYYKRHYRVDPPKEMIDRADVIIYLEFLPSRFRLVRPGKKTVFVPMYDNEWGSKWQWKRIAWSGMGVVSFSRRVGDHARAHGVADVLDVKYFFDPADFKAGEPGPKRVFLWERGDIDRKTAESLFPPSDGYVFDIKKSDEFLERPEYMRRLAGCEIVIAPRRKEGIGMAFLEAMAMGRCVAGHDDATMNEYIVDGCNGVLFDADRPEAVPYEKVKSALEGVAASSAEMHECWKRDEKRIVPFIASLQPCRPTLLNRMKSLLSIPLFIAEGLMYRLFRE